MPAYDYDCCGTIVEAFVPYEDRDNYFVDDCQCTRVFLVSPAMSVAIWHQSAPKEDPATVQLAKRAKDPNDPVREFEPGMERDIQRAKKDREQKETSWIEPKVAEVTRDLWT